MARAKRKAAQTAEEKVAAALVPEAEQPYKVPENWRWVRLGSAYEVNPSYDLPSEGEIAFTPMALVPQGLDSTPVYDFGDSVCLSKGYRRYGEGDVVFAKISPCFENRKSMIVNNLPSSVGVGSTELIVLHSDTIDPKFTYLLVIDERFIRDGAQFKGTVGQQRLRKGFVENYAVPLPPLPEQRRIVSRVESLFAKLEEAESKLRNVLAQSETRRTAILHDAFSSRIAGYEMSLDEVCCSIYDGDHMPPPKADVGVPFLVISDVKGGTPSFQNARFVPSDYYDSLTETRKPKRGDVLYTLVGSYGIPAIVNTDRRFCFQRHMALLKPRAEYVTTGYLRYLLASPQAYELATNIATGTAQLTVPIRGLRKLRFRFPPLAEQQEIVRRLDFLFAKQDAADVRVNDALSAISTLRQTILAHALRGELGTNDPTEESSVALLSEVL